MRDNSGMLRPATLTAEGTLEARGAITGNATPASERTAILRAVAEIAGRKAEARQNRISPNPISRDAFSTKRPLRNSRAPSANLASYSPCRCAKPDLTLIRSLPVSDVTARR